MVCTPKQNSDLCKYTDIQCAIHHGCRSLQLDLLLLMLASFADDLRCLYYNSKMAVFAAKKTEKNENLFLVLGVQFVAL